MRVAVLDDYQATAAAMADWDALAVEVDFFHDPIPVAELGAVLEPYDVLVLMRERTAFSAATLSGLTRLRHVVTTGMRNASLDVGHLQGRGIPVSGTAGPADAPPGVSSTAEVAWALIFAIAKRVAWDDRGLREGRWQGGFPTNLGGGTLGLAGLGRLGAQMVAPANAFGMEVIAWSQNLTRERAAEMGATRVEFGELLDRSDVLSIHLVLSDRTRGLFDAPALARLKDGASIINTSRGPIIDADALVAELHRGRIFAGLDVFDTEPIPPDDPILSAPNAVLTPHLGYVSETALRLMYGQVVEDIAAFMAGTPIRLLS